MTCPGFEEQYAAAWQDWEATLEAGDWLLLATDAMSEYVLHRFETGTAPAFLSTLAELQALTRPEAWRRFEEFVLAERQQGKLRNDDVGLAVLRLKG
jgi:hypothetical protein